jgi:hypothetical protein
MNPAIAAFFPPCAPPAHVSHVSPSVFRASILRKGLIPRSGGCAIDQKKYPMVYAQCIRPGDVFNDYWYPHCAHICDVCEVQENGRRIWSETFSYPELIAEEFDFWCISTETLRGTWYVDLICERDFRRTQTGVLYVCTEQHIPPGALSLHRLSPARQPDGTLDLVLKPFNHRKK